jgi:hypothetical protein
MATVDQLREILIKKLPNSVIDYCVELWQKEPFSFKTTRSRKSKLGDFRYRRDRSTQTITINADLNPYQFLVTYLHEVAHLHSFIRFGWDVQPHGKEWKSTFQGLVYPILTEKYLPLDLIIPLRKHMINPKASSSTDLFLMKEISKYDRLDLEDTLQFLSDLKPGERFLLSNRKFEKLETRRTRVLCLEVQTGEKFLIAQMAKVKPT